MCKAGLKALDIIFLSLSPLETGWRAELPAVFNPISSPRRRAAITSLPFSIPAPGATAAPSKAAALPGGEETSSCRAPHPCLGQEGTRQGGRGDANRNQEVS